MTHEQWHIAMQDAVSRLGDDEVRELDTRITIVYQSIGPNS